MMQNRKKKISGNCASGQQPPVFAVIVSARRVFARSVLHTANLYAAPDLTVRLVQATAPAVGIGIESGRYAYATRN